VPLIPVEQNGIWYAPGVSAVAAPVPIGRRMFVVGPHVVGFDDAFAEPLVMRAFYDLSADPPSVRRAFAKTFTYVGYLQFCRLTFRGQAIAPSVYGGRLAGRDVYLADDKWFVDMMAPADAAVRNVRLPFYAFNGLLSDGSIQSEVDLYIHPRPNGSLLAAPVTTQTQSRYASISADISTGLLTPADVAPFLVDDDSIVRVIPTSGAALAVTEAYRIALNSLETVPDWGAAAPPLAGLDETQVATQVVGNYVLLTLPDNENLGPTLCVTVEGSQAQPAVVVRLLTFYDMEQMEADAGRAVLRRLAASVEPDPDAMDIEDQVVPGRGHSGLLPTPIALPADAFVLSLDYVTAAAGITPHGGQNLWPLNAFSWSVLFQFDEDTGTLESTAVTAPQAVESFDGSSAIRRFTDAVKAPPPGATVDTTNFTLAAMRRDNFAAGRKMRFVDQRGADV
jgi:hypothetical protein